jgi:hypothetical protein
LSTAGTFDQLYRLPISVITDGFFPLGAGKFCLPTELGTQDHYLVDKRDPARKANFTISCSMVLWFCAGLLQTEQTWSSTTAGQPARLESIYLFLQFFPWRNIIGKLYEKFE